MKEIDEVFSCWDTVPEMAIAVNESHWTVQKWKGRRSIPQRAWPAVIKGAKAKGKNLTADDLLSMHASALKRCG